MSAAARQQLRIRVQLLDDDNSPIGFPITIIGREYWTLLRLIDAGDGLAIETIIQKHGRAYPGHHPRYKLHTKLDVLEEAGKLAA
ncbi:hypothetical protein [Rhizobium sp. BK661]|uniref:winged helix domain-containing protein n=1 Tax=Rhizobium sp. BK661 TaxID=2586991 RepID=UPI00386DC3C4